MECDACQANSSSFAGETTCWSLSKRAGAKVAKLFDAMQNFQGAPTGCLNWINPQECRQHGRWHIKFVLKRKWQAKGTPSGSQHALPNSDAPVCLHTRRFCRGAHWITQGTGVQAAWLEWPNNCSHLLNTDYKWCKWKALFFYRSLYSIFFLSIDTDSTDMLPSFLEEHATLHQRY